MSKDVAMQRKILIVLHQEHSTPGRIGRLLRQQGYALDIRRPRFGDTLPKTMHEHDGAIIFGGPMSANDSDDWLRREIDWIGVPLHENKPFLGVCLGGQMLARHLGHRVYCHPEGKVEIGYYPIHPTDHGHALCKTAFPDQVYQWHGEGFDLPKGATLLAAGTDFEAQAFQYGDQAVALQFHPEVTYAMMCRWTTRAAERLHLPNAQPRHRHLEEWFLHDGAVARWTESFLRQWVQGNPSEIAKTKAA